MTQVLPAARLAGWGPSLRAALLVYVPVRVGLLLLGLLGVGVLPANDPVDVPGWPASTPSAPWHAVVTSWERQDALWFLRIADSGYAVDDGSAAFFPLFPLLVRGLGWLLGGSLLLAAYLVANLALVAALTVLHRLTLLELGSELLARRTLLYLAVFPAAVFLFAPYSESLFLALTVGCLYAARRSAWLPAAALGALASGSRSAGVLLVLPLAVEAVLQHRGSVRVTAARLAAAAAASLGTAAYLLWWQVVHGDGGRPLAVQRSAWQREPAWPWQTAVDGVQEGTRYLGRRLPHARPAAVRGRGRGRRLGGPAAAGELVNLVLGVAGPAADAAVRRPAAAVDAALPGRAAAAVLGVGPPR